MQKGKKLEEEAYDVKRSTFLISQTHRYGASFQEKKLKNVFSSCKSYKSIPGGLPRDKRGSYFAGFSAYTLNPNKRLLSFLAPPQTSLGKYNFDSRWIGLALESASRIDTLFFKLV